MLLKAVESAEQELVPDNPVYRVTQSQVLRKAASDSDHDAIIFDYLARLEQSIGKLSSQIEFQPKYPTALQLSSGGLGSAVRAGIYPGLRLGLGSLNEKDQKLEIRGDSLGSGSLKN